MALVTALMAVTIGVMQFSLGYIIRDYGFTPAIWLMVITLVLAFLYILIPSCFIETIDRDKTGSVDIKGSIKSGWKDLKRLFKENTYIRRWRLGTLFGIDFMREILETSYPIVLLYGLGPPFCWDPVTLSGYLLITTFLGATGKGTLIKYFIYLKTYRCKTIYFIPATSSIFYEILALE